MNRKLRLFALPTLLLALCSTASAEGPGGQRDFAMHRTAKLQKHLNLSDSQADKVYEVFKTTKAKASCAEKQSFSEKRDCREEVRKGVREQLAEILSEDQLAQLDTMREKRKERWKKHRRKGYGHQ